MADSQHPSHALTAWSTHQCVAGLLGWELGDFCFFFCEYCLLYVYSDMGHEQNIVLDVYTGFPTACLEDPTRPDMPCLSGKIGAVL